MSKVKLTIARVFSYLVATEPHWPEISSIQLNPAISKSQRKWEKFLIKYNTVY